MRTSRVLFAIYMTLSAGMAIKGFVPGIRDAGFYGVGVGEWSMFSERVDQRPVEVFVDGEPSDRRWLWHAQIVQASRAVYDQRILDALAFHVAEVTGEPVKVRLEWRKNCGPWRLETAEAMPP